MRGNNPKSLWWKDDVQAAVKRFWQLAVKRQKKGIWNLTEKRREKLKGVYIKAKRK